MKPQEKGKSTDHREQGYFRDVPCFLVACLVHGAVLSQSTGLRFGLPAPQAEAAIPVEFVSKIPVSPFLAPVAPGNGRSENPPAHGPGPIQVEKVKKGNPHPKVHRKPKAHRVLTEAERQRLIELKQKREMALAIAREQRAQLEQFKRQQAEVRRQAMLERKRQEELLRREAEARRQEELARRRAVLAEQRRIKALQRAEVESQLASMDNPDEAISNVADADPPSIGGKKVLLAGAAMVSSDIPVTHDPVYDRDGRDGRDALNAKPSGGGFGDPDGGPVSWSIQGPAGSRRLLKRKVPGCPEWVSRKNLDLTVRLKFRVLDDGSIKEGVLVERTSGFPNLDRSSIDALRQWRFDAFRGQSGVKVPEIWGVVTFHFIPG